MALISSNLDHSLSVFFIENRKDRGGRWADGKENPCCAWFFDFQMSRLGKGQNGRLLLICPFLNMGATNTRSSVTQIQNFINDSVSPTDATSLAIVIIDLVTVLPSFHRHVRTEDETIITAVTDPTIKTSTCFFHRILAV
jgi:hypothetical protein